MSSLAIILAAAVACAPVSTSLTKTNLKTIASKIPQGTLLIAQKYGGTDPHGDDPHGDDPHDEVHDKDLPANQNKNVGKAPKDVYGGNYPNTQAPY